MISGSFASGALAQIDEADVQRMLTLNETLFVEHKKDIGKQTAEQLIKAVASFANTLGGWILVGVFDGKPTGDSTRWGTDGDLPLVDVVRDRLRGLIDPLPAFEAKVFVIDGKSVGVVRIYESSDTPHIDVREGSIWVREVAGDVDNTKNRKMGKGETERRKYEASAIRGQEQLSQLARRGDAARARVAALFDPALGTTPLITNSFGPDFVKSKHGLRPALTDRAQIIVRAAPYTLPARFRAWSTTADAASAVLGAMEGLTQLSGFSNDWLKPNPAGISMSVGLDPGALHKDSSGIGLRSWAKAGVDGAGVVAASFALESPREGRRPRATPKDVGAKLAAPVVEAVARLLTDGEFLGRAWFQIDIVGLSTCLMLEGADKFSDWVPTSLDVSLPGGQDDLDLLVTLAINACARSGGIRAWDPPPGLH